MGRLFRAIREIVREIRFFGDAEVATLRKQLEQQKAQLQELKAAREERLRSEEALALTELRRAVQSLQHVDEQHQQQQHAVVEATEELGTKLKNKMVADMHQRAADVLQSIDFQAVATGEGEAMPGHAAAGGAAGGSGAGSAAGRQPPRAKGKRGGGRSGASTR